MDIVLVGRWVLLALGVVTVFGAVCFKLKYPSAKRPVWMWVFGALFAGLGVFGLEFLPKYRNWLTALSDLVKNPSEKTYAAFLDHVGSGTLPVEVQQLGINYAVTHPVKGMDAILTNAIAKAPDNTQGAKALKWAEDSYKGKQREIDHLLETKIRPEVAKKFAPTTRSLIHATVRELPDERRRILGIEPTHVKEYRKMATAFPGKPEKLISRTPVRVPRTSDR